MPFLTSFAAELHITLKASELFRLGPLKVTNSILYGSMTALFVMIFMIYATTKISLRPQKGVVAGAVDSMVEYIVNLLEGPFGSRAKAARFAPVFGVYFIFIIFSNLLELVPWVGEGIYKNSAGVHEALFRPFTADLNGTVALAVVAILMVQYLSIREQGAKKHLQHYFTDKPLNPLNMFIGLLEVFGELTRILSLSLRLFLNTAVGEILITVFASLIIADGRTPFAVLPILLFEALVAYIQAYVFTILAATYLGLAISHAHEDHDTETPRADAKVEHAADRGGTIQLG
jgi:F-type H+-transporting ATPase subunit a